VNSRLLVRQQKMHGSQKCRGELAELAVDDIWQIANAGDEELRKMTHSIRRGWSTTEIGAEDNDGLSWQRAVTVWLHCICWMWIISTGIWMMVMEDFTVCWFWMQCRRLMQLRNKSVNFVFLSFIICPMRQQHWTDYKISLCLSVSQSVSQWASQRILGPPPYLVNGWS